jgi:hypothetical protein
MSYYLEAPNVGARVINVSIPAPTNSDGFNFEIEFECRVTGTDLILNGLNGAASNDICFLKVSVLEYRRTGNSNINMTHGVTISDWHVYRLVFTGSGSGNIAFYVDGVFKANYTPSSSIATPEFGALLQLPSSTRVGDFRYFKFTDFNNAASNRMYDARAHVSGDSLLRETANNVNGTFNSAWLSLPPNFVADAPAVTPISFTGTIANQTFTVGDVVSLDLNPFFSGTETPFVITSIGASLSGIGLSIAAGVVVGTVTEGTATGVQVRGTDAALNTADSNLFNITVNAAPPGNSATVSFTMPQFAVAVSAETSAPTTDAVLASEPLKDNTGTLLANQALDYVAIYNNTTGELVLRVTGLSTNASGVFSVENAALSAGVTYKVDWKVTSQSAGRMPTKAAV